MTQYTTNAANDAQSQALALAEAGIHIFPLAHRSKAPLTPQGHLDATTDAAKIAAWFEKWPKANVGAALEPSGLVVVGPDSPEWVTAFTEKGLPDTATVQSGGGEGHLHYWYHRPEGCPVHRSCKSGQYDLLSNGYAVIPPSLHPSGKRYEWVRTPAEFLNGDGTFHFPDAPEWVVAMLASASGPKAKSKQEPRPEPPPPRDDDEPPVRLDAEGLKWWNGTYTVSKAEGGIDASRTLFRIGIVLAKAGATRKTLIEALRDRDETLGYAKFYNRKDGGARDYEREAQKVWDTVERERPVHAEGIKISGINSRDLLRRTFGPTEWVVDELLPVGSAVLSGKPKIGKSWMLLDLALAVATEGEWLGRPVKRSGRVLYLALEDNQRRLHNRLKKLIFGEESFDPYDDDAEIDFSNMQTPTDGIDFFTEWPRMGLGGLEKIGEWCARHSDAALILVDTLRMFRPPSTGKVGMYENDYEDLSQIHKFGSRIGVPIATAHHNRKMNADDPLDVVSGSNGITGAVDNILVLQRGRGTADAEMFCTGRDYPADLNLGLSFEQGKAKWNVLGDAAELRYSKEQAGILTALREAGESLTPTRIAAALGGEIKANTITQRLKTMEKKGLVKNVGGGKWWVV